MTNLLQQTIEKLQENGKTPEDIRWVGGKDFWFSWKEFASVADVEYDRGFGSPKVATDLLIVGDDWWLERWVFDGSEGWDFKTTPARPLTRTQPRTVVAPKPPEFGWETLAELQNAR